MIRIACYLPDGTVKSDISIEQAKQYLQNSDAFVWFDMYAPTEPEWKPILEELFAFHPLAIEDAIRDVHVPKVDDFESYLLIIVHAVTFNAKTMQFDTVEVDLFVGKNYVVTHREEDLAVFDRTWQVIGHDIRLMGRGSSWFLHAMLDRIVDHVMLAIDELDDAIEELEDAIMLAETKGGALLDRIFEVKRAVLRLRRILSPQREVANKLARGDFRIIDPNVRIYFRDIYDHLVRITDINENLRDLITGVLDLYLTVASNRMNDIMKTLTIVSVIFLPLTLVAGIYGMNFAHMPELTWQYGYFAALGLMGLIVAGFLYYFYRKGWIE